MTTNEKTENIFWQASFPLPKNTNIEQAEIYTSEFEEIANSTIIEMTENEEPKLIKILFLQKLPPQKDFICNILQDFSELKLSLNKISIERLEDKNWLEHVYREFPPITIGKFFVFGEHYDGNIPDGLIPLQISTAMAFGSGEHQTTQGCLLALQKLKQQGLEFKNILDMGCGSGILAVAAAKLWQNAKIIAIDIEEESKIATDKHALINNCPNIKAQCADGYKSELVEKNTKFDLIISNILANVLIEFSENLANNLQKEGYAVLAGLLERQIEKVSTAHTKNGLKLIDKNIIENWAILTMQN